MARLPRLVLPGQIHLVIHRGHNGQPVFLGDEDRLSYLSALKDGLVDQAVELHAYALLPDAVRLMLTPKASGSLAGLMQFIGRRFVPSFNRRHERSGTPWEGRFRSTVVEAAGHFAACLRFVERPPSIDASASATAWSSLPHHLGARVDPLIREHPAFWAFGNTPFEREAAYRRFSEEVIPAGELASILHATTHGWVLGSAAFIAQAGEQTQRRPKPAARGRPRKQTAKTSAQTTPPTGDDVSPIN